MLGALGRRSRAPRFTTILVFATTLAFFVAPSALAAAGCRPIKRCDTAPPSVSISSPLSGTTVSGVVTVKGVAADNVAVARVEVRVDAGAFVLATGTSSWSSALNTAAYPSGAHTVTARATDTGGRTASATVSLTFNNTSTGTGTGTGSTCSGVNVSPSTASAVQSLLNGSPAGSTFCFRAGVYHWDREVVVPSYAKLLAEPGTVITGDDAYPAALVGYGSEAGQHDVTVKGFIVERSTGRNGIKAGWRWVIENNETRYNHFSGIAGNVGSTVRNNFTHHNFIYGMIEGGAGMVAEGNEISFNNTSRRHIGDEGGTKFIRTNGMTFRNNYVHDNYGEGIWFDWDNNNIVIEGNRVENNEGIGIFYEVSYNGIIRNNTLKGNGVPSGGSMWTVGQLYLNDSQNVEIYGNVIDTDSENAISISDTYRDDDYAGSVYTSNIRSANIFVHDNTIIIRGSGGMVGLVGRSSALNDGNRFDRNTYRVYSTSCACFYWNGTLNYTGWKQFGHDPAGILQLV